MSGTSADGIDVALVGILGRGFNLRLDLLAHEHFDYPQPVREAILQAMNSLHASVADLSRLNFLLGELYAVAIKKTCRRSRTKKLDLIGCHGQTIYHQGDRSAYLGKNISCTWQTGEAAVIAERLRVPVVSDFRPADMAAGGQAAPLVPMFDYCVYREMKKSRVLLNLGGIANVTVLPAASRSEDVMAFDTGPANMVIDACMDRIFGRGFDRNGAMAARGRALESVVAKVMRAPYFSALPPKSCGREEYGEQFVTQFVAACERENARKEDVIATATALTATTIVDAYARFCKPQFERLAPNAKVELIAAGGGVHNTTLMRMLRELFEPK